MTGDTLIGIECRNCGAEYGPERHFEGCPDCRTDELASNFKPVYDFDALRGDVTRDVIDDGGGVWMLPELLPVDSSVKRPLGEGDTPLIECDVLGSEFGIDNLYLKDESQNPTWSYKDRMCSVALAHAKSCGAEVATIASTGNHGASTAAYAARYGLESVIFTIPEVPKTMKTLMQVYGANVLATPTPEDRWVAMQAAIETYDWYPTGNYVTPPVGSNFYGIEGYKTIAYEILSDLDWTVPDWVVVPTAYADGISGIWHGFTDLRDLGLVDETPRMVAVEPFGPITNAVEKGLDHVEAVETGSTEAFSIGAGISTHQGLVTIQESDGTGVVLNEGLMEFQKRLGATTGVYAEASAAISMAAVEKLLDNGVVGSDDLVVAIDSSTGLKDPDTTAETLPEVPVVEPALDEVRSTLADVYELDL
jgi:threonine synthase